MVRRPPSSTLFPTRRSSDLLCAQRGGELLLNLAARCAVEILPMSLAVARSEEHTSELQSPVHLVCRLLLEKKNATAGPVDLAVRPDEPYPVHHRRPAPGTHA